MSTTVTTRKMTRITSVVILKAPNDVNGNPHQAVIVQGDDGFEGASLYSYNGLGQAITATLKMIEKNRGIIWDSEEEQEAHIKELRANEPYGLRVPVKSRKAITDTIKAACIDYQRIG